jgi:hypothetical protein
VQGRRQRELRRIGEGPRREGSGAGGLTDLVTDQSILVVIAVGALAARRAFKAFKKIFTNIFQNIYILFIFYLHFINILFIFHLYFIYISFTFHLRKYL